MPDSKEAKPTETKEAAPKKTAAKKEPKTEPKTEAKPKVETTEPKTPETKPKAKTPKKIKLDTPDIKQLFEAGAHFGHPTAKWSPKMAPYIHSKRAGVHIINLEVTVPMLEDALEFIARTTESGKQLIIVGTKRQARDIVKSKCEEAGVLYVSERWIGGTLTNWSTISGRISRMKELEQGLENGDYESKYSKLEVQRLREEMEKLEEMFGGIRDMDSTPGVMFVLDAIKDAGAIREAHTVGVPVVSVVDTNVDPTGIEYPVPGNDDAIKSLELYVDLAIAAAKAGEANVDKSEEQ